MPKTFSLHAEILDDEGDPIMVVPLARNEEFFSHDHLVARVGDIRSRILLHLKVSDRDGADAASVSSGVNKNPACKLDIRHTDG